MQLIDFQLQDGDNGERHNNRRRSRPGCYTPTFIFAAKPANMNENLVHRLRQELDGIESEGLFKKERIISSEQGAEILVNGKTVINLCANNYLGLSSHPKVMDAAHKALDKRGYGMSSVRFICGTQDIHKEL